MRLIVKILIIGLLVTTSLSFFSCRRYHDRPQLSGIVPEFQIYRFDSELLNLDENHLLDNLFEVEKKYPQFFKLYTEGIIQVGKSNSVNFLSDFQIFLNDPMQGLAFEEVKNQYNSFETQAEGITEAFKYFTYYYPNKSLPDIYTFIGYFNQSMVVDSGLIGIALEKYLNPSFQPYIELGIPSFVRSKMDKKYLVIDCIRALAQTEFLFKDSTNYLIAEMIHAGRELYFIQKMIPDAKPQDIIQYSDEEWEYCKVNESRMWKFMVDQKHLFSDDFRLIRRYLYDGPFTPGFDKSPARTGAFIGWQIVNSYMHSNSELRLNDLMAEKDYLKILNQSSYQP